MFLDPKFSSKYYKPIYTVKLLKILTPKKIAVVTLKLNKGALLRVIRPKDADGIANSVDPDQTAPGAV